MPVLEQADVARTFEGALAKAFAGRSERGGSLLEWGMRFFPHYFTLAPGKHHRRIAYCLEQWSRERCIRASIVAARNSAKSTYLTFLLPLWSICEGTEEYIWLLADTYRQAGKHLKGIQFELEHNERLADAYPHACGRGSEWNQEGILTRNGVRVEPLGTGQKMRGRRERSARPTLIVIDDPEGDEASFSATRRTSTRDWATKGVFKAGGPRTNILLAGTVVHRECLVAYCAGMPGWRTLNFRAIKTWPTRMDLWDEWEQVLCDNTVPPEEADQKARDFFLANKAEMEKDAEVLWPESEDLYDLMHLRATEGKTAFEAEKQNNPIDPSKCEWEPSLFEGDDIWFDEWPRGLICTVMALDPSKGKKDKPGDYQAIVMLGVDENMTLYVDADIKRRPIKGMVQEFVGLGRVFEPDVAVVEEEQFQELIIPECEEEAVAEKIVFPVVGVSTGNKPKALRIRRLGPFISRRRVRYKRRSPGVRKLIEHLMDFPAGKHDDGPDAMEMALRKAWELLADQGHAVAVQSPY
jgi:predicted phage terminase large subunit-like protein